jgi:hypothetical protein
MLSSCLRRQCLVAAQCRITPKRNPEKRAAERNLKRLRDAPKYTMETSEQKDTHKWMTDRRIKAMTKAIEIGFNTNRLTQKIDKKSMKEFMKTMKDLEMRLYWEKLHHRQFEDDFADYFEGYFERDIETLPSYLRDEYMIAVKQDNEARELNNSMAEEFNPENMFWEQTMRMNAEEEAQLIALRYRMRKIVESRLMEDE